MSGAANTARHALTFGRTRKTAMFAVSQDADTLAKKQSWKASGGTHVVIQAGWDEMQASAGATPTTAAANALKARFADAATAGLRVIFEPAVQYTPTWVQTGVPNFRNQFAVDYTGALGENIRDWVWSETGRAYLMDFYAKTWAVLTSTETSLIESVRCGFGYYGETSYPPAGASSPYNWWGFSPPAQTGTGLAVDQVVCPLPGVEPFGSTAVGTTGSANDLTWVAWYRDAATVRMRSIVDKYRSLGWKGKIHVLLPSTGVRSNWTSADANWREQHAKGCDHASQMDSFCQVNGVYPWCTWLERLDFTTPVVADNDKAPFRKIAELAAARGCGSYLWGENAAGATNTDMNNMFGSTGALKNGWTGVLWVDWNSLQGANPTQANLSSNIAGYTVP